jgi:hypothetical protein
LGPVAPSATSITVGALPVALWMAVLRAGPTSGFSPVSLKLLLPSSSTSTTCWLPRLTAVNALVKNEARPVLVPISSAPKPAVTALPPLVPTEERATAGVAGAPGTELRMSTPGAEMSTDLAP